MAQRTIEESADKMVSEKNKLTEHEASLEREEKILEGIRDSLKGQFLCSTPARLLTLPFRCPLDKTQVFHDQIEVKQRELQPWTAKIDAKQAEIDVASGERDALTKKAEAIKTASKDAQKNFDTLQAEHQAKLKELDQLKAEKVALNRAAQAAQKQLQVHRNFKLKYNPVFNCS